MVFCGSLKVLRKSYSKHKPKDGTRALFMRSLPPGVNGDAVYYDRIRHSATPRLSEANCTHPAGSLISHPIHQARLAGVAFAG